jgi:hypothetical protein
MVSQIRKPVAAARLRTQKVQRGVRKAEVKLHDSNTDLLELSADELIPGEELRTCVEKSLQVEVKLHKAVNELEAVSSLLATAEDEIALLLDKSKDATMAGKRSGEGLSSVLEHIRAGRHQNELGNGAGDKPSQPPASKSPRNSRT